MQPKPRQKRCGVAAKELETPTQPCRLPGTAPGKGSVSPPSNGDRSWLSVTGAGLGVGRGEAEDMVEGQHVAAGAGPDQHQGEGRAHTQRVLNVDQPAIETEKLGNQDELVRHCLVRARVPGQEGFAQLPTLLPLGDESAYGSGEKRGQVGAGGSCS